MYTCLYLEKIGKLRTVNSIFGNIDDLYLFCCVVEEGSLLAASRKLALPVSTMSRRLSALEKRLGLRLLEKRGRELLPTQTGREAFAQLSSGMEQIELGLLHLRHHSERVDGKVKVVMPHRIYGDFVGPVIEQYMRDHPKVKLDLILSQEYATPETDRDLVITFDIRGMDEMIARPFFHARHAFFVSQAYLARVGSITTPEEMATLDWISMTRDTQIPVYQGEQLITMIDTQPRLVVNDINALIRAVEQGFGVASLPLRHVDPSRGLIRVLPEYHRGMRQAYLVYRQRAYQPKALTLLIEALLEKVQQAEFRARP
ncbi:TPA: LysR family transcriptional regulator [Vibrio vulnificus]|nr:LysR family transcriptional regulator [Vibrio vulnificus]HDY8043314.1 LysR family transcriptional regulator [Vibrio vulnificus]